MPTCWRFMAEPRPSAQALLGTWRVMHPGGITLTSHEMQRFAVLQ